MKRLKQITAFIIILLFSLVANAQISLAPSFVFVDENNGVGNVFVSNNSEKSYEVSVNFVYGYPGSDTLGNMVMNYNDTISSAQFALDPMIRAFPRSFLLKAGEQRTVRVQVVPNQRRKEGFFFTRMKVLAKPQTNDVSDSTSQSIGTKINFNFEQITAVFYHKGKVTTGLEIKGLDVQQNQGVLDIRTNLHRTGDAPFLGSLVVKLKDGAGKVVSESQSTAAIYFDLIRHIELKLDNVVPGSYTLELSFETRRNDMLTSDLIQALPIVKKTTVIIQ
jgi:hypothetical protein